MHKTRLWFGRAATVATVAIMLLVSMGQAEGNTYDARSDFSTSENPAGPWRYGYTGTPGGGITLYPSNQAVTDDFGTTYRWLDPASPTYGNRVPGLWADITFSSSNLTLHSGNSAGEYYSVLRFVAPVDCQSSVSISFTPYDHNTAGVETLVYHNSTLLWSDNLAYGQTGLYEADVPLLLGDVLDILVGPGAGQYYSDSTSVRAVITVPEPTSLSLLALGGLALLRRRRMA